MILTKICFFTCYMSIGLGGGDLVSGMYLALDWLVMDICELVGKILFGGATNPSFNVEESSLDPSFYASPRIVVYSSEGSMS